MTRYVLTCVLAILLANSATAEKEEGFRVWSSCGGAVTQPTTITVSHSRNDPDIFTCIWTIQATANVKVLIQSNHVHLDTDCDNNYIKIYDGLLVNTEKGLATICGNTNSRLIIPASVNTMTVQFRSQKQGNNFSARVFFADSETMGCGGGFHLRDNLPVTLGPPRIMIYGKEMINCIWNIWSSENTTISIKFLTVNFPVCDNKPYNLDNYHQHYDTDRNGLHWPTICDSTCSCNFMEVWDGIVPDSYKIGSYCGQCSPPEVVSSSNKISVWMSAVPSLGFSIRITVNRAPLCNPTTVAVSSNPTRLQSPGYPSLERGINCVYEFQADTYPVHLTIKNLDIQPGTTTDVCDKDKVVIEKRSTLNSLGKDYVIRNEVLDLVTQTQRYEFCGSHEKIELQIQGSFFLNLVTTTDNVSYKGLEIEVVRG